MPRLNSHADIFRDWSGLLEAAQRSPEVLPEVEKERLVLEQSLRESEGLKARQEELTGLRQQVTQQLDAALARGKDAAMQFRAVLKAKFGPRNERLVQFKMAPLRKRAPRTKTVFVDRLVVDAGAADAQKGAQPAAPAPKPVD